MSFAVTHQRCCINRRGLMWQRPPLWRGRASAAAGGEPQRGAAFRRTVPNAALRQQCQLREVIDGEIEIVRVKDRFAAPSAGGWRDVLVSDHVDQYAPAPPYSAYRARTYCAPCACGLPLACGAP